MTSLSSLAGDDATETMLAVTCRVDIDRDIYDVAESVTSNGAVKTTLTVAQDDVDSGTTELILTVA
jgi:hypothetical protein